MVRVGLTHSEWDLIVSVLWDRATQVSLHQCCGLNDHRLQISERQLETTLRNKWAVTAALDTWLSILMATSRPMVCFPQIDCGGMRWSQNVRLFLPPSYLWQIHCGRDYFSEWMSPPRSPLCVHTRWGHPFHVFQAASSSFEQDWATKQVPHPQGGLHWGVRQICILPPSVFWG